MVDTLLSPVPTIPLTVSILTQNVLKSLSDVPIEDAHSNSITASSTSLTIPTGGASRYEVGDLIEWRADGTNEIATVTAVADTTLTITRGTLFTTAAIHGAAALFVKYPRFFGVNVAKAVQDALDEDLYPDLFSVYEAQLTPTTEVWYSIAAAAEDVLDAYQKSTSGPVEMFPVQVSAPRYTDSTLSTTKKAIRLYGTATGSGTVFVQYARIPAVGDLSAGMGRVVEYGACRRLLEWKAAEITGRADIAQSGTMAPGAIGRDARYFLALQDQARRTEKAILDRRFPRRMRNYFHKHYADVTGSSNVTYSLRVN